MTASVGMAFAGLDEDVTANLVYNADVAMYQAKRQGGGRHQLFDLRDGVLAGGACRAAFGRGRGRARRIHH